MQGSGLRVWGVGVRNLVGGLGPILMAQIGNMVWVCVRMKGERAREIQSETPGYEASRAAHRLVAGEGEA